MDKSIYVFDITLNPSKPFPGFDSFLKIHAKFPVYKDNIYVGSTIWPFLMHRLPKVGKTGRTKPIKARILEYDQATSFTYLTLERYETVNILKLYPYSKIHDSQLVVGWEGG